MTISRTFSRMQNFYQRQALKSAPFVTDGQCVQKVMEGGLAKGRPSNATADSEYLGISWGIYKGRPNNFPKIQEVKVGAASGATATALLSKQVANADDIYVYKGSDYSGTLMSKTAGGAAPTGATDYNLEADGRTITVDDQNANTTLFVVYNYVPSVADYKFAYEAGGDLFPGNNGPAILGQVSVITAGIVYTDQFDKSVNWNAVNAATPIKGGANGIFTTNGNGCICTGVKVYEAPSMDKPFLGLTLDYSI